MPPIDIVVDDDHWLAALPDAEILAARCFDAALAREPRLGGSLALLLTDDETVRDLNNRFRSRDKATNVLSFPSGESAPGFLGDIAIASGVAAREAAEYRTDIEGYTAHLLVHGMLHLVGHDHEADAEAEIMEALESDILDALGVYNPYAAEEPGKS